MDEATSSKIANRGYAYECVKCGVYRGEKRYVEAHIFKYHLALDQVPFYCSLCHYMTKTEKDLQKHVKGYKPHREALEARPEKTPEEEAKFLHKNETPVTLTEEHMRRLTLEDSRKVWLDRVKSPGVTQPVLPPAPSEEALVPEALPASIPAIPEALREPAALPMPSLPEIDLPEIPTDKEYDLLQDILGDEAADASKEFPSMEVEEDLGSSKSVVALLTGIREALEQHTQLLTMMNTGIRKNTMAIDELASSMRSWERRERNQQLQSSSYYRPYQRRGGFRQTGSRTAESRGSRDGRMKSAVSVVKKSRR